MENSPLPPDHYYIAELSEREFHSDTMTRLSPLEREHLKDWNNHFAERYAIEAVKEAQEKNR